MQFMIGDRKVIYVDHSKIENIFVCKYFLCISVLFVLFEDGMIDFVAFRASGIDDGDKMRDAV